MEDESDGEEIEITAAEVVEKLEEAWLNEKFSPELLHSKVELVDCLVEQMHEMEEKLKLAPKADVAASLQMMELERVKFIISSYLRRRIEKIEDYTVHILEEEADRSHDEPSKLSPEEFQYVKEFSDNMETLFTSLALRHMTANMQGLDRKKVPRPNLNSHVFLTVTEKQDQVQVDPEAIVGLLVPADSDDAVNPQISSFISQIRRHAIMSSSLRTSKPKRVSEPQIWFN